MASQKLEKKYFFNNLFCEFKMLCYRASLKRKSELLMSSLKQEAIGQMFDQIANTYDPINRILSFGQDVRWRKNVAKVMPADGFLSVLDVATGTADLLLTICKNNSNIAMAWGVDISKNMLAIGQRKVDDMGYGDRAFLKVGDGCSLPFADNSFDIAMNAFGIRNMVDIELGLREMSRVLKPGGLSLILEFSLPKNSAVRFF